MHTLIRLLTVAATLVLAAQPAASWVVLLDNPDGDLTVDVVLDPQGGTVDLAAYNFSFAVDETKVTWTGSYTNTPPAPVQGDAFGPMVQTIPGQLDAFNGADQGIAAPITSPTVLGTITFQLALGAVPDDIADITFATGVQGFGVIANGQYLAGAAVPTASGAGLSFPVRACNDGVDNDGDGLVDTADPGCFNAIGFNESPQCDDEIDNDNDGRIDWDGGIGGATPDPQCSSGGHINKEGVGRACGLGFEAGLAALAWSFVRRRRARGRA